MTAFARAHRTFPWGSATWELRSVNHRYLDTSGRLVEPLLHLEGSLRERLRTRLARGKVDARLEFDSSAAVSAAIDRSALANLLSLLAETQAAGAVIRPPSGLEILRWPGVLVGIDRQGETLQGDIERTFEIALDGLLEARRREGAALSAVISARLADIADVLGALRTDAAALPASVRLRLQQRLHKLDADIAPQRLAQEVALLAQRADICEELDRLDTHTAEMRSVLAGIGPAGRKLDFLAQELGREANTIASKAADVAISSRAVTLKVLVEQIREQVQNIE